MYLHGEFIDRLSRTVKVEILTGNDRTETIEIDGEGSGVRFTEDPVQITTGDTDTFSPLVTTSASISLDASICLAGLFVTDCRDAVVRITREGDCLFAGYLEPMAYSQPFSSAWDPIELNCIDALSALQYENYRRVGAPGVVYDLVKAEAADRSFMEIIKELLTPHIAALGGGDAGSIYYDGSKSVENTTRSLDCIAISELLFLGSDEDDVNTCRDVLEEILRYLNLHICQRGTSFYIFDWGSIDYIGTTPRPMQWISLTGENNRQETRGLVMIDDTVAGFDDAQINLGEVYNRISLTCSVENVENIVESPLDASELSSPYTNTQLYVSEYSSDGEGEQALKAFSALVCGTPEAYTYPAGKYTDWYVQVRTHPRWTFPMWDEEGEDFIGAYSSSGTEQQRIPNALYSSSSPAKAAILSFGKVSEDMSHTDNSPAERTTSDYLVIAVNGNGSDSQPFPYDTKLKEYAPVAVYQGGAAGGMLSPADDDTTNYLVFSGSILLNPLVKMSAGYYAVKDKSYNTLKDEIWHDTVPSRVNGDGRYYTRKYWKATCPGDTPVWDAAQTDGLVPPVDDGPQEYEFKYSAIDGRTDTISKVGVLACMLIVGEKCVVETGDGGSIDDYEWRTFKTREECADDDEYYSQSFTLGFDPKMGDKLIGTQFSLQNNVTFQLGIDAKGTAIPIRRSDKVSGPVKFMVLGPVNTYWNEITRRHPTWFRHTQWTENAVPLLAHVSSIYLREFEAKIYSDNGLINNTDESDLIYISETDDSFMNRHDSTTFRITTALTRQECVDLGFSNSVMLSAPRNLATDEPLRAILDTITGERAKPEQLWVDAYWREYHTPKIMLEQSFEDVPGNVGLLHQYTHPAIPTKSFYPIAVTRSLAEATATITLKEKWH